MERKVDQLVTDLEAQTLGDGVHSLGQKRPASSQDVISGSVHRHKAIPQTETEIQAILADKRRGPHRKDRKVKKWSQDEDRLLKDAVSKYGAKNWKLVATHVPGRDHTQCLQRWSKCLAPGLKKGMWTQEEDALLTQCVHRQLALISEIGEAQQKKIPWGEVCKDIDGRTAKQCRERWVNNLDPSICKGAWTKAEDDMMKQLYKKYGPSWAAIAKEMNGRTENGVKIRWKALARTKEGLEAAAAAPKPLVSKPSKAKKNRKGSSDMEDDKESENSDDISDSEDDSDEEDQAAEPHVAPRLPMGQFSSALDSIQNIGPGGTLYAQPSFTTAYVPGMPTASFGSGYYIPGIGPQTPAEMASMTAMSDVSSGHMVDEALRLLRGSNSAFPGLPPMSSQHVIQTKDRAMSRTDSGRSGWSEGLVGGRAVRRDDDAASRSSNSSIGSTFSGFMSASGLSKYNQSQPGSTGDRTFSFSSLASKYPSSLTVPPLSASGSVTQSSSFLPQGSFNVAGVPPPLMQMASSGLSAQSSNNSVMYYAPNPMQQIPPGSAPIQMIFFPLAAPSTQGAPPNVEFFSLASGLNKGNKN